jgi:hypothetical protein
MRIMDYFHSPAITRWYRYRHPQARQNRCFFRAIWAGDGLVFIAENQESSRHEAHGNNAVFGLLWLLAYKHPLIIPWYYGASQEPPLNRFMFQRQMPVNRPPDPGD